MRSTDSSTFFVYLWINQLFFGKNKDIIAPCGNNRWMKLQIRQMKAVFCNKVSVDEIRSNFFYESFYCDMTGYEGKVEIFPATR